MNLFHRLFSKPRSIDLKGYPEKIWVRWFEDNECVSVSNRALPNTVEYHRAAKEADKP